MSENAIDFLTTVTSGTHTEQIQSNQQKSLPFKILEWIFVDFPNLYFLNGTVMILVSG